ncbi:ATP-binding protein [uncultured Desulfobulbus sp.]|uniref:ATP-binding protein n=1 Tax=uncultured Desulfobulbus sp. TaxID=239745 RepID=UPI0029C78330|nr:ATP-binding protein [uncultured Desulfobulbus sp.]
MKSELDQRISHPLATRLLRVVFGFFLVVVICLTIAQMVIEYRYQEKSIRKEFSNIQTSFEHVLAGQIWHLDEDALRSTVEGIVELPGIVGLKIADPNGKLIALCGIVNTADGKGETCLHVKLLGYTPDDGHVHSWKPYRFDLFEADFPIIYSVNQQPRVLGRVTLYSNSSVVLNRVKASFLMLGIKTVVEIALLWLIFKLVFVRLLKKPLAELTTAVEGVTLDNLDAVKVSAPNGIRDELGVLAESFNRMLLDLQSEITNRRIADESLATSEVKLNSILRVAPVGIGLTKRRVFTSVNPAMCDLTGYSSEELLGQRTRLLYLTDEEYLSNGNKLNAQIDQQGTGMTEATWFRKDGQRVDILLSAAPMVPNDSEGEFTVIATDITERKQAEEALIRQQRFIKLNNLIANVFLTSSRNEVFADVLNVILTALDSRFGFFGYINEAGDLVSPTLTRDVWDQCQVADKSIVFPRANWKGLWCRALLEKQTFISNENLQVPEGHVALENALATPIVYNDNLIGLFVVANKAGGYDKDDRDLLESVAAQTAPILFAIQEEARRKIEHEKLEVQLHQAQKMESVGRLAGGVAHDFNNMLGVILGYTELAMERVEPDNPLHANLEKIQGAAQRSADLTRQLLAFARKQIVSPKVIDLNDTIESVLKMLLRLIGEDIDLAWRPGKEVWPVKMDPIQVDQILTNLCVNARDAIVDTGKLTIETSIASFDEEYCSHHAGIVPGDYVLLAVSDTGCGMDKETQAHLFEPFFTTKEMGKGTGLGLATVYGVVKQNNGFINVYSEPRKGTTFKIYLPRHLDKTVPLPEKEPYKPDERGRETVLLVEDEPTILDMTTEMLERLGYTVLAAGTPGEAIRLTREHPGRIDLLLTDVVMPEMNGRDLAKTLLSIYPDIRRLFMSGYTASVIAHHGVLDEGMHFIHKPFSMKDLGRKLREALEG